MTESKFEEVIKYTMEHCIDTLVVKGKEYRRNNNPFHNFEKGVSITGESREKVIWGFALKHFISIQDMRNDIDEGILPSIETVNEKFGDLINYLLIEKASYIDRITNYKQDLIDCEEVKDVK